MTAVVYPVGVRGVLLRAGRLVRHGEIRRAALVIRQEARMEWAWAKRGNWRAVRNSWNGYLAEVEGHSAGRGWTKRVALRSLARKIRADWQVTS